MLWQGPVEPILVVDADPEMRELLGELLALEGFTSVAVATLAEALRLLDRQAIAAVVAEVQLPDGSGFDLLPALRERHRRVPVVLTAAFGGREFSERARAAGAAAFVDKPFAALDLCAALRAALAASGARQGGGAGGDDGADRRGGAGGDRSAGPGPRGSGRGGGSMPA